MSVQQYFETVGIASRSHNPGRVRAMGKRRTLQEVREQRDAEIKRRAVKQLRGIIRNLQQEVARLDSSINSELELARVRDPAHYVFPVPIKAMPQRRDNLKATISSLLGRLPTIEGSVPSGAVQQK